MRILALDISGQPNRWVSRETAITYHAKGLVGWQLGEGDGFDVTFRGGANRMTGDLSQITTAPIIAVRGESKKNRDFAKPPALTNPELFRRDHHICAYCGNHFHADDLTRDHIIPRSRGGLDKWTNVVSSCQQCNNKKDNRLLEEIGMQLLYVPYAPNRAEALILENRNVIACQMSYLASFLPEHSRVWEKIKHLAN